MWVRGHSKSLKLVPLESFGAVSYSPSIVTMAVSVAVCGIFSVKEWCDFENRVTVSSRWLEMAPINISHTSSFSPSIVAMVISCTVCEIYRLIGKKSRIEISWRCLMLIKLEWLGCRMVKKKYDDILSRFHLISERHRQTGRQTDGQTDGRTDGQNCYINIARQCADAWYKMMSTYC